MVLGPPTRDQWQAQQEKKKKDEEEEQKKQRMIAAAQAIADQQEAQRKAKVSPIEVSSPGVDTGPASISSTSVLEDTTTSTTRPEPTYTRRRYGQPSITERAPITTPEIPTYQGRERPGGGLAVPSGTGSNLGLVASLPVGQVAPVIGDLAVQGAKALGTMAQNNPITDWWNKPRPEWDAGWEVTNEQSDRWNEAMRSWNLGDLQGPNLPGAPSTMLAKGFVGATNLLGNLNAGNIISPIAFAGNMVAAQPLPGSWDGSEEPYSMSQAWAAGVRATSKVNEQVFAAKSDQPLNNVNDYISAFAKNANTFFGSWGEWGQYYLDGLDASKAGLTPTAAQMEYSDPEEIRRARAMGRFISTSGINAASDAFDQVLDNPVLGAQQLAEATEMRRIAENTPNLPTEVKNAMLFSAAIKGAEARRLETQTLLDVYDDNQVWYMELAAGFLFDPFNAIEAVGGLGKVTGILPEGLRPFGRRLAKAGAQAAIDRGAAMGKSVNIIGDVVNQWADFWKSPVSKARSDANWIWNGTIQSLSEVNIKEDAIAVLRALFTDTKNFAEKGIPIDRLADPAIRAQGANGFYFPGWAMLKNPEFNRALRVVKQDTEAFVEAIENLPSLRITAPGEAVNKAEFQSEFLGLFSRWSGWAHTGPRGGTVSAMDGVPFGAKVVKMVQGSEAGKWALEFYDGKYLLSRTIDMPNGEATKMLGNAEAAIKRGVEYTMNPSEMFSDLERKIFSANALNAVPASILRNIFGGFGEALINLGDLRIFNDVTEGFQHVISKTGGMFPDLRQALGRGEIKAPSGVNISSEGYWTKVPDIINNLMLGVPEKGREFRNWTEETMAAKVYVVGWIRGEEAGAKRLAREFRRAFAGIIQDKGQLEMYARGLEQQVISGNRASIAAWGQQVAQGMQGINLRGINPSFPELFTTAQVQEIDDIFKTLTDVSIPQAKQRIGEIIAERMAAVVQAAERKEIYPNRYYWTVADRMKDRTEWISGLQQATQSWQGKPPRITMEKFNELAPIIKEADRLAGEADQAMLGLLQRGYGEPGALNAIYGAFLENQSISNEIRGLADDLIRHVTEQNLAFQAAGLQGAELSAAVGKSWSDYYDMYTELVRGGQQRKLDVVLDALAAVEKGDYSGYANLVGDQVERIFKIIGDTDIEAETRKIQEVGLQFFGDNPELFKKMIDGQRATTDKYVAQMFLALQRNPSLDAMDEFFSTLNAVGRRNAIQNYKWREAMAPIQKLWDEGVKSEDIPKKLWAAARAQRENWSKTHRLNWERLQAGTTRILEKTLAADDPALQALRFTIMDTPTQYRLVGPVTGSKNQRYWVINEATGGMTSMKAKIVPAAAIQALPELKKIAPRLLAEAVGELANTAGIKGIGIPEIDEMIKSVQKTPFTDTYYAIKQNVMEAMSGGTKGMVLGNDNVEKYIMDQFGAIQNSLNRILPQVSQANAAGFRPLGNDFLTLFNQEILPRVDNVYFQADRAGKSAVSISLVDYFNQYWPDMILSLFSPFHIWNTRMMKNALEQQIFHPSVQNNLARIYNQVFNYNQDRGAPNRNMFVIPGPDGNPLSFEIGGVTLAPSLPIHMMIPMFPLMAQFGWADPERANAAYAYMTENQENASWDGTGRKLLGAGLAMNEIAAKAGISQYPWWNAGIDAMLGRRVEDNLGSMGPLMRIMGAAGTKFGYHLARNGSPELGKAIDQLTGVARPFYEPYLTGRLAAAKAGTGELTNQQAYGVQDVAHQKFFNLGPLPEQKPDAVANYDKVREENAWASFVQQTLNWAIPLSFKQEIPGEIELNKAQQLYRESGYDPAGNTGGSRAGKMQFYDEVPGMGPWASRYAVTGESAPQVPNPNAVRPGVAGAQAEYYPAKQAIHEKYNKIIDQAYADHPEWQQPGGRGNMGDITGPIYDAKKAELEALDAQYPSVADIEKKGPLTPSKLSGTDPEEARSALFQGILQMAEQTLGPEPVYPEGGSRSEVADYKAAKAAYEEALAAEVQRMMLDPNIGSLVPGRELPGAGVMPEAGSMPPLEGPQYRPQEGGPPSLLQPSAPLPEAPLPEAPLPEAGLQQPLSDLRQTQAFGENPEDYKPYGFEGGHEGVDYGAEEGTPVVAAAGGTVIHAGESDAANANYGNYVVIRHADGKETWYAHLSGWDVSVGDKVKAGDLLGEVGNTGRSTGAHLHFAIKDPAQADNGQKGFIDPEAYMSTLQQGTPSEVGIMLRAPTSGEAVPAVSPNNIDWGGSAQDLLLQGDNRFKGPEQLATEQAYATAKGQMDTMLQERYPEYVNLRAQWDRTNDEDREAFRKTHPEITAVNLLLWNPDKWQAMEDQFGKGVVMKYALRPSYESGQRSSYYHKNPDVFLAHSWLNGRPKNQQEDRDADSSYNAGADYEQAKELFGPGIWEKVRAYKLINPEDKAAKSQFYKDNPDYEAWNDWWYANMPDLKPGTYAGYFWGGRGDYSSNYEQQDWGSIPHQSWRRSYSPPPIPKYRETGGVGSGWRRWMNEFG